MEKAYLVFLKKSSIAQYLSIPVICPLCSLYHQHWFHLCRLCQQLLSPLLNPCSICAVPLLPGQISCVACSKSPPAYAQAFSAYLYSEPLRHLIHAFKYEGKLHLRRLLAELMLEKLTLDPKELGYLIPVPMHFSKLKKRGFNHAAVLTVLLAKRLQLPSDLYLVEKNSNTLPQAQLSFAERKRNLKEAFSLTRTPPSKVTIIDDLLTTGSTAEAITALFKPYNTQVLIWTLARTPIS